MFPQPFAAGVASLRGGWGLVSAIFTYTNTYSGFPAVGCGGLGPQVPRAPQSLRVGVGGRGPENKSWPTPPPCPKKTNFLVGVWVETETSRHGVDPLPLPQKGGRGAKGGSPLVAATLWWEGRGPGDWETAHVCSRLHWRPADPPLVCKKIFWVVARDSPDGKWPWTTPPCTWSSPPRLRYGRKKKGMASTEVVWSRGKGW